MNYIIREHVGVNGITLADGQSVYDAIFPVLKQQKQVTLDFAGVRIVASPFLNAAVGQLLRDFSPDDLNQYLKFAELPAITRPILRQVIENAKAYYSSEKYRQAVEFALTQEAGVTDDD